MIVLLGILIILFDGISYSVRSIFSFDSVIASSTKFADIVVVGCIIFLYIMNSIIEIAIPKNMYFKVKNENGCVETETLPLEIYASSAKIKNNSDNIGIAEKKAIDI